MDQFQLRYQAAFSSSLSQWIIRVPVKLDIRLAGRSVSARPFFVDSGSDITQLPPTYIPDPSAVRRTTDRLRRFRGAAGSGTGYEVSFAFSFEDLPGWTFPCIAVVNDTLSHGLLAWREIVRRFDLKTAHRTAIPDLRDQLRAGVPGALLLTLYPQAQHDSVRTP